VLAQSCPALCQMKTLAAAEKSWKYLTASLEKNRLLSRTFTIGKGAHSFGRLVFICRKQIVQSFMTDRGHEPFSVPVNIKSRSATLELTYRDRGDLRAPCSRGLYPLQARVLSPGLVSHSFSGRHILWGTYSLSSFPTLGSCHLLNRALHLLEVNALAAHLDACWIEDKFHLSELVGVAGDEVQKGRHVAEDALESSCWYVVL
jgi:hypothetical protein